MKVFASVLGQIDNVGDTVLRRGFLDAIRPMGDLQVYVGARDASYLSGLGLQSTDTLHRASAAWRREISSAILAGPSVYAFNAGEMEVQQSYAMQYIRLAPLLAASRLRGGHAIHAGFGVRTPTIWRLPIVGTLALCDIVSWRDAYSRRVMGIGRVAPDWAFALGSADDTLLDPRGAEGRPLLSVAVRYNGVRPDATWVRSVRALADSLGLQVMVVAQILRDGPLAEDLALELGGDSLIWEGPDHATQEERLRAVYRRSSVLVTDRLHAAVIALTEGALPVSLTDSPTSKVTRTLEAAGIAGTAVDSRLASAAVLEGVARDVLGRRNAIMRHVVDSRATLRTLTDDIRALTR